MSVFVSIIIPTYNRAFSLAKTLESILKLKTEIAKFEIIVVDNGSTDNTAEILAAFQTKTSNLRFYFEEIPGLLSGRHLGLQEAQGEIVTFIDDDVVVSETWLDVIMEIMTQQEDVVLLTGPCLPKYESDPPEFIQDFWTEEAIGKHCAWLSLMDLGNEVKEIDPTFVWGLNFTIRKQVCLDLGGFHPDNIPKRLQKFQGDGETGLAFKAKSKGFKALYHPKVKLYHQIPNSRLTENYFAERAFYQGVCNSFTQLRLENGLYDRLIFESHLPISRFKKVKKALKNSFFPIKKVALETGNSLKNTLLKAELEGFHFHQQQFKENKIVRDWVLKENYLEYKYLNFCDEQIEKNN